MSHIVNLLLFFILNINSSFAFCYTNNNDSFFNEPLLDSSKIEISQISSGANMTTGLLHINIPVNVECSINLFAINNNRLYSSGQQHTFILFPGEYNLEVSGMLLKEIPVSKGMDTRVKAGTLYVVSDLSWTMYDESKTKKLYSAGRTAKVEFLTGIYNIEIKGSLHRIEIKDGETLEYKDTSEQLDTTKKLNVEFNIIPTTKDSSANVKPQNKSLPPVTSENKVPTTILPQIENSEIMFGKNMVTGVVNIDVAPDVDYSIKISNAIGGSQLFNSTQQRNFSLFPGMYDIEISGKILKSIPVIKGIDTRIKAGALHISSDILWTVYDDNKTKKLYSSTSNGKVELPAGIYQLEIKGVLYNIEIKDGEILEFNNTSSPISHAPEIVSKDSTKIISVNTTPMNPLAEPGDKKWELKQSLAAKGNTGRVLINISKEIESIITVSQSASNKEVAYSGILTKVRNFSLAPGNYNVTISGSMVKNVPVQKGMDTRIKSGILNVANSEIWTLYDEKKTLQIYFSTTAKKIGLPTGIYQVEVKGNIQPIIIKDGEILDFKINN